MKFLCKCILLLLSGCLFLPKPVNSQNIKDTRIYLNYQNQSIELTGGFPQLIKLGLHYSLFSPQCNSFLAATLTTPIINKILFQQSISESNLDYEKFFNRCRCDSSAMLYIYRTQKNTILKKDEKKFNKNIFDASLNEIRDSVFQALSKRYPQFSIKVLINSEIRSVEAQEAYLKKGSSTTLFSAHILGAAADFSIYFNGYLVDPKLNGSGVFQSFEPYRILGKFILDKGYFWGIPWDPGHMQLRRKFQDILNEFPELQENVNLITSYCKIVKTDSIPIKYKPIIEIMDDKFSFTKVRNYDPSIPWKEDSLLAPIDADTLKTTSLIR